MGEQVALGVLAAVIGDPGAWLAEFRALPVDAFGLESKPLASAVRAIANRGHVVSLASVAQELDRARVRVSRETFEELGVPPSPAKAPEMFVALREQLALHRAEGLPLALQRAITSTLGEGPARAISEARAILDRFERDCLAEIDGGPEHVGGILARQWQQAEQGRQGRFYSTPWPSVDEVLEGLRPSEIVIVGAATGSGKSQVALQLADHLATVERAPTVFVGLEMSNAETVERLLARRSGIPSRRIARGGLTGDEGAAVLGASREASEAPLWFDDRPRSFEGLASMARAQKARHGLEVLVVDYMQLVRPTGRVESREREVASVVYGLKALAQELEILVIAPVQINREHTRRDDPRPRLSDIRESGAIEQAANRVLFLHRPARFDPEAPPNRLELIVAKQRNGAPDAVISLDWRPDLSRIADPAWGRR